MATRTAPLVRDLFGGAIKAVIPAEGKDVSEMREIPDNQEVFCHPTTDQSIMIDILEYQNHVQGEHAARYHFDDIANSNDSLDNFEVVKIEPIPMEKLSMKQYGLILMVDDTHSCVSLHVPHGTWCSDTWLLRGRQSVSKFKEGNEAKNVVQISLALLRLPQFSTDIVVTFNNPTSISQSSSSSKSMAGGSADSSSNWTEETFYFCVTSLSLLHPELLFGENT